MHIGNQVFNIYNLAIPKHFLTTPMHIFDSYSLSKVCSGNLAFYDHNILVLTVPFNTYINQLLYKNISENCFQPSLRF